MEEEVVESVELEFEMKWDVVEVRMSETKGKPSGESSLEDN